MVHDQRPPTRHDVKTKAHVCTDQLDKGLLGRVHGKLGIDTEACRKGREVFPHPIA
jgi:hypothetical protein